jgi:hypothetical protein
VHTKQGVMIKNFANFVAKNLRFSQKTNVMIMFFAKSSSMPIFSPNFLAKIFLKNHNISPRSQVTKLKFTSIDSVDHLRSFFFAAFTFLWPLSKLASICANDLPLQMMFCYFEAKASKRLFRQQFFVTIFLGGAALGI